MTTMHGGPVRLAGGVALVLAAGVVAGGCTTSTPKQAGPPPTVAGGTPTTVGSVPTTAAQAQTGERRPEAASFLVRAGGCERFAEAVRAVAVEAVGPYGFAGSPSYAAGDALAPTTTMLASGAAAAGGAERAAAAPRAGVDFSGTNVQEAGVDEPDTVKTDGRMLVSVVDGRLRVVDVTSEPRLVGTLDLAHVAGRLLLVGDRALVLSTGSGPIPELIPGAPAPRPTTIVTVVDLKDPARPSVARTHTIDGSYVDARLVGGVARIVTRSSPDISFPRPSSGRVAPDDQATAANAEVVRKAAPAAFLPKGASCEDAFVPVEGAGVGTVAVQSVDPGAESPGPAVAVVASASTVYASATRLFVATNRHRGDAQGRTGGAVPFEPSRTAIHAFDITDPAKARYAGSGDVPGRLLNQFSLSEHDGVLRVATTIDGTAGSGRDPGIPVPMPMPVPRPGPSGRSTAPGTAPSSNGQTPPATSPVTTVVTSPATASVGAPTQSESRVSILRPAGEEWVEVGAVGGLGRGERIYAVRFLGAAGYVVTFRQVDPLYVLDLRDVRSPKVTGELKITGYSAYLHPAGEGRLLGIGQEATDQGRRLGTQLSLFDVKDPASPTKLAGAVVAQGSSAAESDHYAFLFWPATGLVVAPVQSYGGDIQGRGFSRQPFVGAVAFKVGDRSVAEAGRITHPGSTPIERTIVVRDRLLTVSRIGIAANDLASLADRGYLTFR